MTPQEDEDAVLLAFSQVPPGAVMTAFGILSYLPDREFQDFAMNGIGGRGGGCKMGLVATQRAQGALSRAIGKGQVIKVGITPAPVAFLVKGRPIEPSAPWVALYRLA